MMSSSMLERELDEASGTASMDHCASCGKRLNSKDGPSSSSSSSSACASCFSVAYCGKECQVSHWSSRHKGECKHLAFTAFLRLLDSAGAKQAIARITDHYTEAGDKPFLSRLLGLTWGLRRSNMKGSKLALDLHYTALNGLAVLAKNVDRSPAEMQRMGRLIVRALTELTNWGPEEEVRNGEAVHQRTSCLYRLQEMGMYPEVASLCRQQAGRVEGECGNKEEVFSFLKVWLGALAAMAVRKEDDEAALVPLMVEAADVVGRAVPLVPHIPYLALNANGVLWGKVVGYVGVTLTANLKKHDLAIKPLRHALRFAEPMERFHYSHLLMDALVSTVRFDEAVTLAHQFFSEGGGGAAMMREYPGELVLTVSMKAAIALYELGMDDEALAELRRAEAEAPSSSASLYFPLPSLTLPLELVGLPGQFLDRATMSRHIESMKADALGAKGGEREDQQARDLDNKIFANSGHASPQALVRLAAWQLKQQGPGSDAEKSLRLALLCTDEHRGMDAIFPRATEIKYRAMEMLASILEAKEGGSGQDSKEKWLEEAKTLRAKVGRMRKEDEDARGQVLKETRAQAVELAGKRRATAAAVPPPAASKTAALATAAGSSSSTTTTATPRKKTGDDEDHGGEGAATGKAATTTTAAAIDGSKAKKSKNKKKKKRARKAKAGGGGGGEAEKGERQHGEGGEEDEEEDGEEEGRGGEEEAAAEDALLAAEAMASLAVKEEGDDHECAICLLALGEQEGVEEEELICSHRFHADCLGLWVDNCSAKKLAATCPYCRAPLSRRRTKLDR